VQKRADRREPKQRRGGLEMVQSAAPHVARVYCSTNGFRTEQKAFAGRRFPSDDCATPRRGWAGQIAKAGAAAVVGGDEEGIAAAAAPLRVRRGLSLHHTTASQLLSPAPKAFHHN
jgi:hypothetical protein